MQPNRRIDTHPQITECTLKDIPTSIKLFGAAFLLLWIALGVASLVLFLNL